MTCSWSSGGRESNHKVAASIPVKLSLCRNSAAARVTHSGCFPAWTSERSDFVIVSVLMYFIISNVTAFQMFCCCVLCCLQSFFKVLPPTQSLLYRSLTCRYGYCHSRVVLFCSPTLSASLRQKCNTVT